MQWFLVYGERIAQGEILTPIALLRGCLPVDTKRANGSGAKLAIISPGKSQHADRTKDLYHRGSPKSGCGSRGEGGG